jgi:hypothetical protein
MSPCVSLRGEDSARKEFVRPERSEGALAARCSVAFTTPRPASASPPSYEAIAEAAGCARGKVRALEQVGVLSWMNRIKRVREYIPRPVQPACSATRCNGSSVTVGRRRGSPACGRGQIKPRMPRRPSTRCNDVARIGQFRHFAGSMNFETNPPHLPGLHGQARTAEDPQNG